jgi:hydroxypyruvate isomerase
MPRFAANLSMMFTEAPFLDRFALAARAGFRAVEFLFPYEHPAAEIAKRLADNGLRQVLFNLPPGDWARGERGLAALPDRRGEFREALARALDYAAARGCT